MNERGGPAAGADPAAEAVPAGDASLHDVVIIGGGPAGLTAGLYCRMRRLSVLVVDVGRVGGQLRSSYPEKPVHDWPGRPEVAALELADDLAGHAERMEVALAEHERAVDLRRGAGGLVVVTRDVDTGEERQRPAGAVIVAIGAGAMEPRRLGVPGEDALGEDSVTYRLPIAARVRDRSVVVAGGGDAALESAQLAHAAGAQVTIVHRSAEFRAMEANREAIERLGIPCRLGTRVDSLETEGTALRAVVLRPSAPDASPERLPCDYLVVNVGAAASLEAVAGWGIEVAGGRIRVDGAMRTSLPGVFACGDIVAYEGKYRLLVSAASEGATAANSAYAFVRRPPTVTMKDLYS
jgi:ferredoxin/flavodoxin---NADP+ reductase